MDMREEKILLEKIGKERPFKVPDGYFSDFNRQMADLLPEKKKMFVMRRRPVQLRYMRPAIAAACIVAAVSVAGIFSFNREGDKEQHVADHYTHPVQYYTIDEMADYAMLDNEEIYNYVISEQ